MYFSSGTGILSRAALYAFSSIFGRFDDARNKSTACRRKRRPLRHRHPVHGSRRKLAGRMQDQRRADLSHRDPVGATSPRSLRRRRGSDHCWRPTLRLCRTCRPPSPCDKHAEQHQRSKAPDTSRLREAHSSQRGFPAPPGRLPPDTKIPGNKCLHPATCLLPKPPRSAG